MPQEKPKNPFKTNIDEYLFLNAATSGITIWLRLVSSSDSRDNSVKLRSFSNNQFEGTTPVLNKTSTEDSQALISDQNPVIPKDKVKCSSTPEGWEFSITMLLARRSMMS